MQFIGSRSDSMSSGDYQGGHSDDYETHSGPPAAASSSAGASGGGSSVSAPATADDDIPF
jgi:hypothetical protein